MYILNRHWIVKAQDSAGINQLPEAHLSVAFKILQSVLNERIKVVQWLLGCSNRLIDQNEMTTSLLLSRESSQGADEVALKAYN